MPSCDQTGFIHFHSSTTSGSASLMSLRILLKVPARRSPSSAILFEMSSEADWLALDFFMFSSWLFRFVSSARRRGLHAAPEEVRESPEQARGRRPAPHLRAIAQCEVGDERR